MFFYYLIFFTKTNYYWPGYVMTEQWDSLIIPSRFPHSPFPQHSLSLCTLLSSVHWRSVSVPDTHKYDDTRPDITKDRIILQNWIWMLTWCFHLPWTRWQVTILSCVTSHWLHLCICSLCHASGMKTIDFTEFWLVGSNMCMHLISARGSIETWSITNRWGKTVSILI